LPQKLKQKSIVTTHSGFANAAKNPPANTAVKPDTKQGSDTARGSNKNNSKSADSGANQQKDVKVGEVSDRKATNGQNSSTKKSGVPGGDFVANENITVKYTRPASAGPTAAQKASVQNKPCVDCGTVTIKQVADHKDPLVVQYYREGKVNVQQQKQLEAVQPHCPTCSSSQGGQLGAFGKKMKKDLEL
jgi:ribosomal protein S27AE